MQRSPDLTDPYCRAGGEQEALGVMYVTYGEYLRRGVPRARVRERGEKERKNKLGRDGGRMREKQAARRTKGERVYSWHESVHVCICVYPYVCVARGGEAREVQRERIRMYSELST